MYRLFNFRNSLRCSRVFTVVPFTRRRVAEERREEEEEEDSLAGGLLARGEAKSESIRRLSSRRREAIELEALTFASDRPE